MLHTAAQAGRQTKTLLPPGNSVEEGSMGSKQLRIDPKPNRHDQGSTGQLGQN